MAKKMMQERGKGNELETFALQFPVTIYHKLSFHKLCMGMNIFSDVHADFWRRCSPPHPSMAA